MTVEEIKAAARAAREAEPKAPESPATQAQLNYIHRLLDERVVSPKMGLTADEIRTRSNALSKPDASKWIKRLLDLPFAPKDDEERAGIWPEVEKGRYALEMADGVVKFYVVDRPKRGRWVGYTFLSVQASDELHPIKDPSAKHVILERIAADPMEASIRYGKLIGVCGVCGRTLTKRESREAGIGPVCASRIG